MNKTGMRKVVDIMIKGGIRPPLLNHVLNIPMHEFKVLSDSECKQIAMTTFNSYMDLKHYFCKE